MIEAEDVLQSDDLALHAQVVDGGQTPDCADAPIRRYPFVHAEARVAALKRCKRAFVRYLIEDPQMIFEPGRQDDHVSE
jgi:hypothetical protein